MLQTFFFAKSLCWTTVFTPGGDMNMTSRMVTVFVVSMSMAWSASLSAQAAASPGAPESKHDGWSTTNLESAGISAKPLREMENAIHAGDFKKIGSVLIARQGKLAYEGYFDGDANTLRDTRSGLLFARGS